MNVGAAFLVPALLVAAAAPSARGADAHVVNITRLACGMDTVAGMPRVE